MIKIIMAQTYIQAYHDGYTITDWGSNAYQHSRQNLENFVNGAYEIGKWVLIGSVMCFVLSGIIQYWYYVLPVVAVVTTFAVAIDFVGQTVKQVWDYFTSFFW